MPSWLLCLPVNDRVAFAEGMRKAGLQDSLYAAVAVLSSP